jgi:hypothetical protein
MQDNANSELPAPKHMPWNKGKLTGANAKCERRRGDRTVNLNVALHRSLMALSGQSSRTRICPLLDQSGQSWILAGDGLSATRSGHTRPG